MNHTLFRSLPLTLFLLVLLAGCGSRRPATIPVEGVLQWKDGSPIGGASIRFMPVEEKGRDAVGYTDKDGTFTLSTFSADDGAIPGDYIVVVTKTASSAPASAQIPPSNPKDPDSMVKAMKAADKVLREQQAKGSLNDIPTIYQGKDSPLKYRVESGGSRVELKLQKS